MKKFNKFSVITVLAVAIGFINSNTTFAATAPDLGVADDYAVFGKAGVTNSGAPTHVWGNVGGDLLSGITGLAPTQVGGNIIAPTAPAVQTAISNAFTALSTPPQETATALSLAGTVTVVPGVYTVLATETLNGTVTLDGAGVYIFRSASAFNVGNGARVLLTNGATACNVFWQIQSTMTIGSDAQMVGTIIADTEAITLGTGATLQGRALSTIASVTLLSNQITVPTCAVPVVIPTPATIATTESDSDIKVKKSASDYTLRSGPKKVTFTYKVTNEGTVALSDISLKDNKCDDVDFKGGDENDDDLLDLDEEWKYECTKKIKETETNTATAKGHANGEEVKDTDKVTVTVSTPTLPAAGFAPEQGNNFWQSVVAFFSF